MPETCDSVEQQRLDALQKLHVLDSAPEPLFDQLAQMASLICGVPVALVSLVDAQRQWFKANVGLSGTQHTPRDYAFCARAIEHDSVFVVPDASLDARFAHNPLVTGEPHIRFYAGAPMMLPDGERVGTLCVIDRQPRQLSAQQTLLLAQLAAVASQALVMRRDLIMQTLSARSDYEERIAQSEARYRAIVEEQQELVSLSLTDGELVFVNTAYAAHFGMQPAQMVGCNLYDYIAPADREQARLALTEVLSSGKPHRGEYRITCADGAQRWVAWSNHVQRDAQGQVLLNSVGRDVSERRRAEQQLRASQAFLAQTGRVAGVGGWEVDLKTQAVQWSEETYRIHGVAPDYVPTIDSAIMFYAAEARSAMQAAVQRGIEHQEPWDLELPFINAQGQALWVRVVGEVESEDGQPRRLFGAFQDITERRQLRQRLAENERFIRMVADGLPLQLAYMDSNMRFRFVNQPSAQRLGLEPAAVLGCTHAELVPAAVAELLAPHFQAALAGQARQFEYDDHVDGQHRRMELRLAPDTDDSGQVRGCFGVAIDVTEHQQAKAQLQQHTATLSAVIEALPAVVAVVQADGRLRLVNSAFEAWSGRQRGELLGRAMLDVISPETSPMWQPRMQQALGGETVSFDLHDEQTRTPEGAGQHLSVSLIPLYGEHGQIDGYVSMAQDITPHKREAVRLLSLAHRDPLTGLLNRRGAAEQFSRLLPDAQAQPLAVLCIDLDHFKAVNDEHGHATGDKVLQIFAERLRALVRPGDVIARPGGDEFTVLLSGVREADHAKAVADKVIRAAAAPMHAGKLMLQLGASVGLAWGADANLSAEAAWADLLARADAKLYEAKQAGRGLQVS